MYSALKNKWLCLLLTLLCFQLKSQEIYPWGDGSTLAPLNDNLIFRPTVVTSYRDFSISNFQFFIKFVYDANVAWVPATYPEGQPHYTATITVYKKVKNHKHCGNCIRIDDKHGWWTQIGRSFEGIYTHNGCFEDRTEDIIMKAYKTIKDLANEELIKMDSILHKPISFKDVPAITVSDSIGSSPFLSSLNSTMIFGGGDSTFFYTPKYDTTEAIIALIEPDLTLKLIDGYVCQNNNLPTKYLSLCKEEIFDDKVLAFTLKKKNSKK